MNAVNGWIKRHEVAAFYIITFTITWGLGFSYDAVINQENFFLAPLVINLFWPLWHFFLWEAEGRPVFSFAYWGQTYLELLPATVTLGWIYNRSKGSILAAGIGHAAANTAFAFLTNLDSQVYVWTTAAAALVMILIDQMGKKLPHDHPAVYHNFEPNGQTGATPTALPTHP